MILTYAPAGFEQWFLDVGEPVADRNAPGEPPALTPDLAKKAIALAQEYGVNMLVHHAKDELWREHRIEW